MIKINIKNYSILLSAILFTGCGGGGSSSTSTTIASISGQVADSYINNLQYTCADNITRTTDINGLFNCTPPVNFKIGNINLGTILTVPDNSHIFPHNILGVAQDDPSVIALAQLFQSLDEDNNPENGIDISDVTLSSFESYVQEDFNSSNIIDYINYVNKTLVDETTATDHLNETIDSTTSIETLDLPTNVTQYLYTPKSVINDELINAVKYMADEERLAYDAYNNLYTYHDSSVKQLNNIPTKSEYYHIKAVQGLVKKYNITNTELYSNELEDLTSGVYEIDTIQNLYDSLYAQGVASKEEALKVGCAIEVTDVNDLDDLDEFITLANEQSASDIVGIFDYLRAGSYNHYWAFDKGLKNLGVSEGCCSLGQDYCKTDAEYPNTSNM
jgi:hypothetical protein